MMKRRPGLLPVLVFLGALLIHLCGTWSLPLMDRDEPRFAEASREMRQRHDFLVPWLNNQTRLDKPPLIYWFQIASYRLFGENEFSARFPSGIAAALTAAALFGFGRRIFDSRTGLAAAVIFTLSAQVLFEAKAAVADLPMILAFTLATWAGWEVVAPAAEPGGPHSRAIPRAFWIGLFYLSLALGFLAKGPVAALPVAALVLYKRSRGERDLNRRMHFECGVPLSIALVLIWAIPACIRTNGDFLRIGLGEHVLGRSLSPMQGHGLRGLAGYFATLPYYAGSVFASFCPWSIYLPGMGRFYRKRENRRPVETYLLWSALSVFAVFTLVATKLPHYILPAFPALSLLAARHLCEGRGGSKRTAARLAGGMIALDLILGLVLFPSIRPFFPSRELALRASPWMGLHTPFASLDDDEPSLIWYFRTQTQEWRQSLSREDLPAYLAKPGPRICILPALTAIDIGLVDPGGSANTGQGGLPGALDWKIFRFSGLDSAKVRKADLIMVVKP